MNSEHTSNLDFSERDLLKIYNTVPRTLSRSVIVASVIPDNRNKNNRIVLTPETSGNYWIIKIDNIKGWLLPKGGQKIDKYQYQTLESLFECQGYESEGTRKFTINKIARVSFILGQGKWFLENKGTLKFGNSSAFFELDAAQQECDTLSLELERSRQENKQLQVEIETSKANIEQLKIQLDLSLKLQKAENYQVEINDRLESFKELVLNEIRDHIEKKLDNKLESFKVLISNQESDRNLRRFDNDSIDINKLIREGIRDDFSQENRNQLEFLQKSILETNSNFPVFYKKLSKQHKQYIDELSQESQNKFNSIENQLREFESTLSELCKFIFEINQKQESNRQEKQVEPSINDIVDDLDQTSNSTSNLLPFGENEYNDYNSLQSSKNNIVKKYNIDKTSLNDATSLDKQAITVKINPDEKDYNGNYFLVGDKKGICWIIKENSFFFLTPRKYTQITTHQFIYLKCFFELKEYQENQTRRFVLEEPARVTRHGQYWRLEVKGILNFGNKISYSSPADLQKTKKQDVFDSNYKKQEIEKLREQNRELQKKLEALKQDQNRTSTHPTTSTFKIKNVQDLINKYDDKPRSLANDVTKVAAIEESIDKRRSGFNAPVIFTETSNDSYWIVEELPLQDGCFYLVPKANLIINNRNHQMIEHVFVCRGYHTRSSPKFKLSFPALVKITSDSKDKWELVEPGELDFS